MKSVEKTARTVDEAVALALEELGVERDRVVVEVLDEGQKGLLGLLGARHAQVRVRVQESKLELVERLMNDICRTMDLDLSVTVQTDPAEDYIRVEAFGNQAGILIGHHGQTLDALQFLLNVAANRVNDNSGRVLLDVEGYRKRRAETLTRLATRLAERVRRTGEAQVLEPMTAQERRIIHLALSDHPDVETTSEGNDPYRRVVIQPRR